MSMMNTGDILETIEMFTQDNLDVRTVTMGISLLDCIDPDPKKACEKIYNKITTKAADLVPAVEHISAEYGIPIINKRISVTPIAMLLGACPDADPVDFAKALDAAGKKVGVNFVGGYTALVHKGFSAGDRRLIESIPTGRDRHRVQLGEYRCHQGGPEHGCHQADGRSREESQRADRRPPVHRRGEAGGVLQRTRGQSLHGRCIPRPRRARL